jgi:hypothetical protein
MIISPLLKKNSQKTSGSLAKKIFLAQAFSILVLSLVFAGYFIRHERTTTRAILVNKGTMMARQLADTCRIGVFAENEELLIDPIDSVMSQKEVLSVRVFNAEGKLLSERHATGGATGKDKAKPDAGKPPSSLTTMQTGEEPLSVEKNSAMEFWIPIRTTNGYSPEEALLSPDSPANRKESIMGFAGITLDTSLRPSKVFS